MKKPLFLLFCAMLSLAVRTQNSYSFSKSSGNVYAELLADSTVPGFDASGLFDLTNAVAGESFYFYQKPFTFGNQTYLSIGSEPFLRVDDDTSAVLIDGASNLIDTIDATTRVSYKLSGMPGSRLLQVQYKNFRLRNGPAGNFINLQFWYYQQSGIIELHYGPRSTNNASGYTNSNGPFIGVFYADAAFNGCYEKLWCNGSPATLYLDSAANFAFKSLHGVPDDGSIYRFTARTLSLPVSLKKTPADVFGLSPNPAADQVKITGLSKAARLFVYNSCGICVGEIQNQDGQTPEINTQNFPEGLYLLRIENVDGTRAEKKLIIRR